MKPTQKTALTGILSALTLALSFIERLLSASLPLPPGVRLGLSNVIVMFSCVALGLPFALGIVVIKAGFVFLTSGVYGGLISLTGGVLSVLTVYFLHRIFKDKLSFVGISVISAVMHNLGQLTAASLIVGSAMYLSLTPVLLLAGVIFGSITGLTLNAAMPAILKILPVMNQTQSKEKEADQNGQNTPGNGTKGR